METTISERYKYSLPDLLASLGGSVGLMIGCSVMSIVEIIMVAVLYAVSLLKLLLYLK